MEKNYLDKQHSINYKNIDYHQLTLSLLGEGVQIGYSPEKAAQIQSNLMNLLSEAIPRYTHLESNSVKTETAQKILVSILYSIDIYLSSLPSLEEALELLFTTDIRDLYENGKKLAYSYMNELKKSIPELKAGKLNVSVTAYTDAIDECFDAFLLHYDLEFDSYYSIVTMDYPILFDDRSWSGIIFIKSYFEKLLIENRFCSHFPIDNVNRLIKGYAYKFKLDPSELLANIPDLILKNSLCSILLGKTDLLPELTDEDCKKLYPLLKGISKEEIIPMLGHALTTLFQMTEETDPDVIRYIEPYVEEFAPQLLHAARENALEGLLVLEEQEETTKKIYYEGKEKLEDEELRKLIDELKACHSGEAKADLIEKKLRNIEDLISVLESFCIFDEEFKVIYGRLGDFELALLATELMEQSPYVKEEELSIDYYNSSENSIYWQENFLDFMKQLESERYQNILQLASQLNTD